MQRHENLRAASFSPIQATKHFADAVLIIVNSTSWVVRSLLAFSEAWGDKQMSAWTRTLNVYFVGLFIVDVTCFTDFRGMLPVEVLFPASANWCLVLWACGFFLYWLIMQKDWEVTSLILTASEVQSECSTCAVILQVAWWPTSNQHWESSELQF